MKFIKDMLSRKPKNTGAAAEEFETVPQFLDVIGDTEKKLGNRTDLNVQPKRTGRVQIVDELSANDTDIDEATLAILDNAQSLLGQDAEKPTVNIWDIEADSAAEVAAAPTGAPARRRRNATRVLSFDAGNDDVVSMFDAAVEAPRAERTKFPVGWILIAGGPGRGECFTLEPGMSQIGRGEDQAIQLDFGDNSISRSNHAAIVYDIEAHAFMLGHGGKKNIVRLNGSPVISNETLKAGDRIQIGETELHFVPLCSEDFNWSDTDAPEEFEDVAIA